MLERFDVLVLGAGAAGLAAARAIARSGQSVALIEARSRIGGRIFTRHVGSALSSAPIPVELGAEFIHGLPEESWNLIREGGLETYELGGTTLRFAGRLSATRDDHGAADILEDMMRWLSRQPPGTDETFAEYLQHTAIDDERRNAAIRYVEGFNAADHRSIGIGALAKQQDAENRIAAERIFHITTGYDSLPRVLLEQVIAAGGQLFLDKPVTAIDWDAGAVTMSGLEGDKRPFAFFGRRAVITLPLGVLQSGRVRFMPIPHHVLAEAARMSVGVAARLPLLFKSSVWRDGSVLKNFPSLAQDLGQLSFLLADSGTLVDSGVPTAWWTPNPVQTPMLVGWAGGPAAVGGLRVDRCLSALSNIFGVSIDYLEKALIGSHLHDWSSDPFACGAYSYAPAGALDASSNIAEPVSQTLYFAGEHTNVSGHWGTVHGALQSGAAAAVEVIGASSY